MDHTSSFKWKLAWQSDSIHKSWEVADGADCTTLINWQIATLEAMVSLPIQVPQADCGYKTEVGSYEGKKVCLTTLFKNTSLAKCTEGRGRSWSKDSINYCIDDKGSYFKAKYIGNTCPTLHTNVGEHFGLPLCHRDYLESIALHNCNNGDGNAVVP